ncbi:hypothetical protein [Aestuariivirga sp.]|uniref:hypothetical protein n=1 Tax=Aestuariivirga sp. TaxID=2650926 RepID=UPI003593F570
MNIPLSKRLFVTRYPAGCATNAELLSAMQTFETVIVLIAYRRFPHALTSCASALESLLQGSSIGAAKKDGLQILVRKATTKSSAVGAFAPDEMNDLRELRNQIVHRGFSPQDDGPSVDLLISTGIPFMELCLREFHHYELLGNLLPEVEKHIQVAQQVHQLAKTVAGGRMSHCLDSLSYLVRLRFAEGNLPGWEDIAQHGEATGNRLERVERAKQQLELAGEVTWPLTCAVCGEPDCAMVELGFDGAKPSRLQPMAMTCADCGFSAGPAQPFMTEVLTTDQVKAAEPLIRQEYGL